MKPLNKYFNKSYIKLEDQIKHKKAAWLIGASDFIIIKEFYEQDSETLIEFRKAYTDKNDTFFILLARLKEKIDFPYNIY